MPLVNDGLIYLGLDPGASGGIARLCGSTLNVTAMPKTEADIWTWTKGSILPIFAVLEANTGYVGGIGNPGSAMFKFGVNHGLLEMALVAAGIPYRKISPAVWQKGLGIPTRKKGKAGESKTQFKNRLKARAQQLYPGAEVTLATADAILIARYCQILCRSEAV